MGELRQGEGKASVPFMLSPQRFKDTFRSKGIKRHTKSFEFQDQVPVSREDSSILWVPRELQFSINDSRPQTAAASLREKRELLVRDFSIQIL